MAGAPLSVSLPPRGFRCPPSVRSWLPRAQACVCQGQSPALVGFSGNAKRGCVLGEQPANKARICVKPAVEEIFSGHLSGEGLDGLVWTGQGCGGSALSREGTPSQSQHGLQVTCAGGCRGSRLLRAPSQPRPVPVPWASEALWSPAVSALHAWPQQSLVAGSTRAVNVQSAWAGRKSGRALEIVHNPWRAYLPRSDRAT